MKKKVATILFIMAFTKILLSDLSAEDAKTSGAFLKLGAGARAVGMGGAFVSVADDASAVYWNPAGLSQISGKEASFMHASMAQDRNYNFLTYVHSLTRIGTLGVSWTNFNIRNIEIWNDENDLIDTAKDSENAFVLSYGKEFYSNLSGGLNLKYLYQKVYENKASGWGIDMGLMYKPINRLSLGLMVQDMGSNLKWDTASGQMDKVPLKIKGGASYRFLNDNLLLSTDVIQILDNNARVNFGLEYKYEIKKISPSTVAIRIGYQSGYVLGNLAGASAGLGYRFKIGTTPFQIDYAFTPYGDLGVAHRISLLICFRTEIHNK